MARPAKSSARTPHKRNSWTWTTRAFWPISTIPPLTAASPELPYEAPPRPAVQGDQQRYKQHADRFGQRLQASLGRSLGRQVEIGKVHFSLFKGPGFSVDSVTIYEDPAIGDR